MRTLRRRLVAILGAAGVGALAAVLRRRAKGGAATVDEPPGPSGAASAPIPPDAQAAIDEARERLRARAEALRQEIDGDADPER